MIVNKINTKSALSEVRVINNTKSQILSRNEIVSFY